MKRGLMALASAFSYFTVLPLGRFAAQEPPGAEALGFLPFVGALVGALAGTFGYAAFALTGMPIWAAVVALIASIALTGAIHLDGFLDSCDGLLVTATPQRRLEIMRDPHHGTFAVVGMFLAGVVWLGALARLRPWELPAALTCSGMLARFAAIGNAYVHPYAAGGSAARAFVSRPGRVAGLFALVALYALDYAATGLRDPLAWLLPPAAIGCALLLGAWASRRLGGVLTGDVYGAMVVSIEVLVLLALPYAR